MPAKIKQILIITTAAVGVFLAGFLFIVTLLTIGQPQ